MSSTPSLLRTFSVSVIRTAVCLSGLLNACFGVHYPSQGARDTKALDVGLTSLFLFFSFSCQEMLSLTPVRQVAPALFAAYATPKLSLVAWFECSSCRFWVHSKCIKLPSATAPETPFSCCYCIHSSVRGFRALSSFSSSLSSLLKRNSSAIDSAVCSLSQLVLLR